MNIPVYRALMDAAYDEGAVRSSDFPAISQLCRRIEAHPPETPVTETAELFFKSPGLDAVCIVCDDRPLGLVTRQKLFLQVFRRFGWEIYKHRSIAELADESALMLDGSLRLDDALNTALARKPEDVYDDIIVVDEDGRYLGLLSVKQMVIEQGHSLASILLQKNLAHERARELERVGELKSQFLANVTHELRSPVNAIIELSELVRMAAENGHLVQVEDRLHLLQTNATNLRSIITNMLDLSKIEAGKMKIFSDSFDLMPLLHHVADTTRVLVGSKPIRVEIVSSESYCPMETDEVKVRQIVQNLASNAAKFTDAGTIAIRQSSEGEFVSIDVCDTGVGISTENLEKLFIAFSQIDDVKSKRHEGTGLGLTISRQLANMLGGSIAVRSQPGRGTTFTLNIPRRYDEQQREIA